MCSFNLLFLLCRVKIPAVYQADVNRGPSTDIFVLRFAEVFKFQLSFDKQQVLAWEQTVPDGKRPNSAALNNS